MTAAAAETTATSNAAALRFRLRAQGIADLADNAALRRFAAAEPDAFHAAVAGFAGIHGPARLWREGVSKPLKLRRPDGNAVLFDGGAPPAGVAGELGRVWSTEALLPPLAALLIEADLRPDDRLLVAGFEPWPWLAALTQGIALVLAKDATPATLRAIAALEGATAVAAPASWLDAASLDDAPPPGAPRAIRLDTPPG
jgi:hypothetical protein